MVVTVVGLGFVGLTTALGLAEYGHIVYGLEANPKRLATIASGKLPFYEPGLDNALERHLGKAFLPVSNWESALANSDIVYYCVGTPYGEDGQADLTYLYGALEQTLAAIKDDKYRVLVTKSTIPPTTTATRIIPFLEKRGVKVGQQLGVANNPEFLREGHCWDDFIQADRIVLGVEDELAQRMLEELYANSGVPVFSVSLNTGEFIKYLSNTSLACLISFANEMSLAADRIGGIQVAEAFRILHLDKRWQNGSIRNYFYPGCGYGGYCLPKDTNAFYANSKVKGFEGRILEQIIATNDKMPKETAQRIIAAAGEDRNTCIGVLGLAFNVGSDDVRDTPSAKIIAELNLQGYKNVVAFDPMAMEAFQMTYDLEYKMLEKYEEVLEQAKVIAITTAWPMFAKIKQHTSKTIIDCRYMLK